MSTLPSGGADDSTSTRSSGSGNGAHVLAARLSASRQPRSIARTRWPSLRWTCTSTCFVEAGLPRLVGHDRTSLSGIVARATNRMAAAVAKANSDATSACVLSETDARLARVHISRLVPFANENAPQSRVD